MVGMQLTFDCGRLWTMSFPYLYMKFNLKKMDLMYFVAYVENNECACHDDGGVKIKCLEVLKGVKECKFACGNVCRVIIY